LTRSPVTLAEVVDGLDREGQLPDGGRERAGRLVDRMGPAEPWYLRLLVGGGAWIASLLLIGFVAGLTGDISALHVVVGLLLVAGAVFARRQVDDLFRVQVSLATSLAGQALVALGFAEIIDWSGGEPVLLLVMAMNAALFFLFPDRVHRVLMVLFAGIALVVLVYLVELNGLVPVLGPAMALGLVVLAKSEARSFARGHGERVRPLATGLMLNAFGCLSLSAVYVLPELGVDFRFYPRPWISTLLLGALFLYAGSDVWPRLVEGRSRAGLVLLYGLFLAIIASAWQMPGLLLGLLVILRGAASASGFTIGAGIAFSASFVAAFFYGIEISMLAKSATMVAAGCVLLLARAVLLRMLGRPVSGREAANG